MHLGTITGIYAGRVALQTNALLDTQVYHLVCSRESKYVDKGEVVATLCGIELHEQSYHDNIRVFDSTKPDLSGRRLCEHCKQKKMAMLETVRPSHRFSSRPSLPSLDRTGAGD